MKVLWRSTVATVVICGFLVFPLPQTVVVPAFVRPTSKPVFSTLSGLIRPQVKYGEAVRSGDVVAVLENPELEKNLQLLKGRAEELQIQLNAMQRSPATANSELIPTLQEAVTAAVNRQNEFEAEFQNLVIFSSRNGTLLPPPATPIQNRSDLPGRWSGAAMDLQNQAAWIDRGTLLGYVGSVSELEVMACVGENEVATISEGQSARFHSRSVSGSFALNVDDVGQLEAEFLPMNLGVAGLIGGRSSESGIVPTTTTYFVTATLSGTNDALPPLYSVGQIRISTKPVSVATRLIRYLRQTF